MRRNKLYMKPLQVNNKAPDKERREDKEFRFIACGVRKCSSGEVQKEYLKHFRLCFVLSGNGFLKKDDEQYIARENVVFLIKPGREVICQAGMLYPWEYIWIDFSGEICENLMKSIGLSGEMPVVHVDSTLVHIAHGMVLKMNGYSQFRPGNTLRKISTLIELFAWLEDFSSEAVMPETIKCQKKESPWEDDKGMKYVEYMENYFHSHMNEKIRMNELAEEMGLAPYYMSHIYKTVRGVSPTYYLTSLRMANGKQQLETTDKAVREIALMCGYDNPIVFSKVFRKYVGCSPRDYRKAARDTKS